MSSRLLLLGLALLLAPACRAERAADIHVSLAPGEGDTFVFQPVAAWAELVDIAGLRRELRISLSSYPTACGALSLPKDDQVLVAVTVVVPGARALGRGSYPWPGEGSLERSASPLALPTVRRGDSSAVLPAGGELILRELDLEPRGRVEGLLAFESSGDGDHPATHLRGAFSARLCSADRRSR